jgi:hypothetical protein
MILVEELGKRKWEEMGISPRTRNGAKICLQSRTLILERRYRREEEQADVRNQESMVRSQRSE